MIARFWDKLFKREDYYRERLLKAKGDEKKILEAKYDALQEIDAILQKVWDDAEENSLIVTGAIPRTPHDKIVLNVAGLQIYEDPEDSQLYYELDNHHFDTEEEVLFYVIGQYNKSVKTDHDWVLQEDGSYNRIER